MTPLEQQVEAALVRECKARGVTQVKVVRRTGFPDRLLVQKGRAVFVELKRVGGRLSIAQGVTHEWLRAQGHTVVVLVGAAAVRDFMEQTFP